jgi:hypothetical protein
MSLMTEYLVIIDQSKAEGLYRLCVSTDDFERLIGAYEDIAIANGKLGGKSGTMFQYTVDLREVQHKAQRCFHLSVKYDGDISELDDYIQTMRSLRQVIARAGGTTETIWDDVSAHFSQKSYPVIHRIENMMRKLISYFMLTTIGKDWVAEASPAQFRDAVDRGKRNQQQYSEALHQVDFIDLADLLFKPYSPGDPQVLAGQIKAAAGFSDLDFEKLRLEYAPRSNWERYFSAIVKCEDVYLRKRWRDLYDLRCKVAHNAILSRSDYESIVKIADALEKPLRLAIDGLSDVKISNADREQVAESVVVGRGDAYRHFVEQWRNLEQTVLVWQTELAEGISPPSEVLTAAVISAYEAADLIDVQIANELRDLLMFRNLLVHDVAGSIAEIEVRTNAEKIEELTVALKRNWRDEIAGAIRALGGEASLLQIYQFLETNSTRARTGNWQAIVRYNINRNSSDTETFKYGGVDMFRRVERGRWALR